MRAEVAKEMESSEWEIVNGDGPAAYLGFHLSGRGKRWDDAAEEREVKSSRNFSVTSTYVFQQCIRGFASIGARISYHTKNVIDSFY